MKNPISLSRRFLPLLPVLAIAVFAQSCKDTTDLMSPVEPQFEKGGKPGKPSPSEPELLEFWVYHDALGCSQKIHIVVSGSYLRIGKGIAHDHFFNAVRDITPHFEYGFGGPKTDPTEFNEDGTVGHADVCFDGIRAEYTDEAGDVTHTAYFVDYPSTSVGGTGADPFAISPSVLISQTKSTSRGKRFQPPGVVVGGETLAPEPSLLPGDLNSEWHDEVTDFGVVRSYAVWKYTESSPAPRGYLFYDDLAVGEASCEVSSRRVGKKVKTLVSTTTISAQITITYGATPPYNQHYWGEGHLVVDGIRSERIHLPQISGTYLLTRSFDGDLSQGQGLVDVEFVADFLQATSGTDDWQGDHFSELYDFVYNPERNTPYTTAGFVGSEWNPDLDKVSKELGDELFPVAHSNTVAVDCQ